MSRDERDVVRGSTTSQSLPPTYTRESMEHGTLAADRQVRADASPMPNSEPNLPIDTAALEADPKIAMALLSAHEEERSRLAEELHDGPAQAFANAIFQTQL